jgi:hypothetical protein
MMQALIRATQKVNYWRSFIKAMTNDEALIKNNLKLFIIRSFVNYLLDFTNVLSDNMHLKK